ncbi:basic leucine zipper 34-like isoform X2 [Momordica charantia]|uniref:Basic leucine zipper 34-like isoform X2 n=1 Tax=Momordica charantia TaxID=3673 RepID=A0A6J1CGA4_MOMCH|nr:basic leucine zipper 34-like isoform X2 [Momordica charantia]
MPHLPPKIPNLATPPNWPHSIATSPALHRDSIAFLEMSMLSRASLASAAPGYAFDRSDDEQFRSMLSDDQPTSSDYNRDHEKEAAAKCEKLHPCQNAATNISSKDRIFDPKRVKRILANRQSARRSRVRKLQYITELERSVTSLQAEVSMLSPRVAFLDQQRLLLNVDNTALKQRIATLSQDKIFKDADEEELKREIERLGQLYHRQQIKTKEPTSPADQNQNQKLLYV